MQTLKLALTFAASCVLSACGGGGGGGTTASTDTATTGNSSVADSVAGKPMALSSSNYESASVEAAVGGLGTINLARRNDLINQLSKFTNGTLTAPCTGGGSRTISQQDSNNNGAVDINETVTLTYSACNENNVVLTGSVSYRFNALLTFTNPSRTAYTQDTTLTFNALKAESTPSAGTTQSAVANGDIRLVASRTAANVGTDTITSSQFQNTYTSGTTTQSRTVTNFSGTVTYTASDYSVSASGTVSSSLIGGATLAVTTPVPFRSLYSDTYPSSGTAVATGANGGRITLTAKDATTVTVGLDANGDGTAESSIDKSWASLQ